MKEEKRKNFKEKLDEARNRRICYAMKYVIEIKQEYREKYLTEPRFVKIPTWLDEEIRCNSEKLLNLSFPRETWVETWLGLKICPTQSIKTIEEIEEF